MSSTGINGSISGVMDLPQYNVGSGSSYYTPDTATSQASIQARGQMAASGVSSPEAPPRQATGVLLQKVVEFREYQEGHKELVTGGTLGVPSKVSNHIFTIIADVFYKKQYDTYDSGHLFRELQKKGAKPEWIQKVLVQMEQAGLIEFVTN